MSNIKLIPLNNLSGENIKNLATMSQTIFGNVEKIKLLQETFNLEVFFLCLVAKNKILSAVAMEKKEDGSFYSLGNSEPINTFDNSAWFYRERENVLELLRELPKFAKAEKLEITIGELPLGISYEVMKFENVDEYSILPDTKIPVCEISQNADVAKGKIVFKKKYRKEIKRKNNRLKDNFGENIEFVEEIKDKEAALEQMLGFFEVSPNSEKSEFMSPQMKSFFGDFAKQETFKLCGLRGNGEFVSFGLYFDQNNVRYLYNMASNPEMYALSPGIICIYNLVEATVARNFKQFSFLRGMERYKFEIGANSCTINSKIIIS